MGARRARPLAALMIGAGAVGLLAGCSAGGTTTGPDTPLSLSSAPATSTTPTTPTTTPPTAPAHRTAAQQAAIDAGRAQAQANSSTTRPSAVATDTIQAWPAVDAGPRANATGTATRVSPGVYSYTVQPDDVSSVIALRFGLCDVDIVDPSASSTGQIQPGDRLTIERRMTAPGVTADDEDHEHEGWRCNYPG